MAEDEKKEEEETKMEETPEEKKEEEKVESEESPPEEEKEEAEFNAEEEIGRTNESVELLAQKVAAMEEALDKTLEEEEKATMEEEPEKKEEVTAEEEPEKKEEEQESKFSKDDFLKVCNRLKAVEAQLGFKRTVSSSKKKTESPYSEEAKAGLKRMGAI